MTRRTLAGAALAVAAVTVAARVFGFLRVAVFARTVGTNPLGDTYQTANTLPNLVFELVAGGALAAAVVPVIAGAVDRGDVEQARRVAAGLLTWVVVLLTPVALAGALLGRPLMSLLVGSTGDPALRAAKVDVGARMLVLFMPQVVLYGVGIVVTGVLQAHRRFLGPALAPLLSSVVVIGCYVTYGVVSRAGGLDGLTRGEELLLALGTTAGVAVLSLSLLVPLRGLGLRLRPSLSLPDGVASSVRRLAAAGVAAIAAQQVALAVVLRLTNAEPGAVVGYQIAYTLFLLPWAVLAVPVATTAFPAMAAAYEGSDDESYATVTAGSLRMVLLAMGLAAAVLVASADPVASVVVGDSSSPVARGVAAFAPGLLGYGVLALLTRALYARHRARDVAVATVAAFGVTAVLAVTLSSFLPRADRVAAVAWAHSVGMTAGGVLLMLALRRTAGSAALRGAARALLIAVGAGVVAALVGGLAADASSAAPDWLAAIATPILTASLYVTAIALVHPATATEVRTQLARSRADRGA
ncbi:MAG TPA: lipid II flippase MurJ [Frankiaceae bacterium]|nr:lipid II flippase MurJ [Frankiaceae bacterium]